MSVWLGSNKKGTSTDRSGPTWDPWFIIQYNPYKSIIYILYKYNPMYKWGYSMYNWGYRLNLLSGMHPPERRCGGRFREYLRNTVSPWWDMNGILMGRCWVAFISWVNLCIVVEIKLLNRLIRSNMFGCIISSSWDIFARFGMWSAQKVQFRLWPKWWKPQENMDCFRILKWWVKRYDFCGSLKAMST